MAAWGSVPEWIESVGTITVAAVAVFQSTIRGWFYKPQFRLSSKTEPPDCSGVPITELTTGQKIADSLYLRLWVENVGNAPAASVEVYAQSLERQRADGAWETVKAFPPMNLRWSNINSVVYPVISPEMGKHCDCAHLVDPATRDDPRLHETNAELHLANNVASLTVDLIATPNHRGNIVGPGTYRLSLKVAAANSKVSTWLVTLAFDGHWTAAAADMMTDHVAISVARA